MNINSHFFFFLIRNEDFIYEKKDVQQVEKGTRCPKKKLDTWLVHETIDHIKDKAKRTKMWKCL